MSSYIGEGKGREGKSDGPQNIKGLHVACYLELDVPDLQN